MSKNTFAYTGSAIKPVATVVNNDDEVLRANSKSGKYSVVKTITKGTTVSFTNTKLTKSKTYYYKVRAYRKVGTKKVYTAYSAVKYVKVTK